MVENYLANAIQLFQYNKSLGDKTFSQLDDADLFWQANDYSNSIAILVNHLWGNMMSRWTDFLTDDGEKEWRKRDLEFESIIKTRSDLLEKWNEGWSCLSSALEQLNAKSFNTEIYIRNQKHTIVDAINRQLTHYSYHVGQIVFIGASLKGAEWKSLSIPKGQSKEFNAEKFSRGKHGGHFADDLMEEKK